MPTPRYSASALASSTGEFLRRAQAAGLGKGFSGHSGRVGMAQDLAATGVELPALMTAGRWKSAKMPARYTERDSRSGPGGQVLPGERGLEPIFGRTTKYTKHEVYGKIQKAAS